MSSPAYWREYRKNNRAKVQQIQRSYYERNRELVIQRAKLSVQRLRVSRPDFARRANLKRNYGMTLDDYQRMLDAQQGLCAICYERETVKGGRAGGVRPLAIDHDHQTNRVRGLLCQRCNVALGHIRDNVLILHSMIAYLGDHSG